MGTTSRPWLSSYAPGVPATVEVPDESLVDLLEGSVERFGSRVALDFLGAATTYAVLGDRVDRVAEALRRLGVQTGDRVALVLPNCPQNVVAFYAALRLGADRRRAQPALHRRELQHQLERPRRPGRDRVGQGRSGGAAGGGKHGGGARGRGGPHRSAPARQAPDAPAAGPPRPAPPSAAMTAPAPGVPQWDHLVAQAARSTRNTPGPAQETSPSCSTPAGQRAARRARSSPTATSWPMRCRAAPGSPGWPTGEETFYAVLPLFHAYGLTLCLTFSVGIGGHPGALPALRRRPGARGDRPAAGHRSCRPSRRSTSGSPPRPESAGSTCPRCPLRASPAPWRCPPSPSSCWEDATGGLLVEGYGMTETSPVALGNPVSQAPAHRAQSGCPSPPPRHASSTRRTPTQELAPRRAR